MSGPKVSVYSLTGRARKIVDGQIRCEQRAIACHTQTSSLLQIIESYSEDFDRLLGNLSLLSKRTSEGTVRIQEIHEFQMSVNKEIAEIRKELRANQPHISVKYRITEEAYAEKQAELKRVQELKKRAEKLQQKVESLFNQNDFISESRETTKKLQESIADDLSSVESFDFDDAPPDTSFQDKKKTIENRLYVLLNDSSLPDRILTEIKQLFTKLQTINEMLYLNTFEAVSVDGIEKRIREYRQALKQKQEEYAELYTRYKALCIMSGEEAKQIPYSETAVSEISTEIERIEQDLVRQREQAYIQDSVDEVLEEMGYELIGSREVRKKSGKRFRSELFTFNEGTAVNVTYSPDGHISMELGGVAREDRIPTEEETQVLTQDMESFCGEFAEFERRMRAKGIIVGKRIALSPPTAEYAAIINVTDYNVADSTQISEMDAKEKRRKQKEKKVMRRSE